MLLAIHSVLPHGLSYLVPVPVSSATPRDAATQLDTWSSGSSAPRVSLVYWILIMVNLLAIKYSKYHFLLYLSEL